jgi:hypothetical protein
VQFGGQHARAADGANSLHRDEEEAGGQARQQAGAAVGTGTDLRHPGDRPHHGQQHQRTPVQVPGLKSKYRHAGKQQQKRQLDELAPDHQRQRHPGGDPEYRLENEHHVAIQPALVERVERVDAVGIKEVHRQVQQQAEGDCEQQSAPRAATGPEQAARRRPKQPDQRRQQQALGQGEQQRVRVATVMQQVTERARQ